MTNLQILLRAFLIYAITVVSGSLMWIIMYTMDLHFAGLTLFLSSAFGLFALPILFFSIKRIYSRHPARKTRIKKLLIYTFIASIVVLLAAFLFDPRFVLMGFPYAFFALGATMLVPIWLKD